MAGALEDCLVVAGGLEAVEPKRKVGFGKNILRKKSEVKCLAWAKMFKVLFAFVRY